MIGFDDDRLEYDEVTPELRHERARERMRLIPPVGSRYDRTGVREDLHRGLVGSRR